MATGMFEQYADRIRDLSAARLATHQSLRESLLLEQEDPFTICYAPFDYLRNV